MNNTFRFLGICVMTIEDRVQDIAVQLAKIEGRDLATKKWQLIVGALIMAWLGFTSFYQIPNESDKIIEHLKVKDVLADLNLMAVQAKSDADSISTMKDKATDNSSQILRLLDQNMTGTITIGSKCFKPTQLVRCYWNEDHMTWLDNLGECEGAGYKVEQQYLVLAEC